MRRVATLAASFLGWLVVGALAALALSVAAPPIVGARAMTVLTGSMRPAVDPGDVVVSRMVAARDVRPGDVVTFPDAQRGGALVTHRVRLVRRTGDRLAVTTRGDANTGVERWTIAPGGRVGRVAYRVPRLGYVTSGLRLPFGFVAFVLLPALGLAALQLRAIWTDEDAGARAGARG